jgi:ribonuclease VapC
MRVVVLDSWAVLALLRGERPAVEIVGHYVNQAEGGRARLLISVINLGEVFYRLVQVEGVARARQHVARFRAGPIEVVQARESLVMDAALVKAEHPVSYADAFAVATARAERGLLVTGDPEILTLPRSVVQTRRIERAPR